MAGTVTITLNYTPRLVRAAALAYVRRGLGAGSLWAVAALLAAGAFLTVSDPGGVMSGVFYGAVAVLLAAVAGLYLVHCRRGLARLARMRHPQAVLELGEDGIRVTTQTSTFSTAWSSIEALWRFREVWLLVLGAGQFMTLPVADLSAEAKARLAAKFPG